MDNAHFNILCFPALYRIYILSCEGVTIDEFGLEIGFIDHFQVINTSNYNTIANIHTLQITTAHAESFQSAVSSPVIPW
jgi:hypothetical protein